MVVSLVLGLYPAHWPPSPCPSASNLLTLYINNTFGNSNIIKYHRKNDRYASLYLNWLSALNKQKTFRQPIRENMTDMLPLQWILKIGDIPVKTSHLRLGREDTSHLRWSQDLQLFTNFAKLKLNSRNFIKTLQRQVCYVVILSTY